MTTERFPVSISWDQYPVHYADINLKAFFTDPDLAYQAIKATNIHFGMGKCGGYTFIPGVICSDMGGMLAYPDNSLPYETAYPVRSIEDIENLKIPEINDCASEGYNRRILELMTEEGQTPGIYISSLMERAAHLIGYQELLILMRKDQYHFRMLMDKVFSFTQREILHYREKFPSENFWVSTAYSMESNDLMSPEDFRKSCVPYIDLLHKDLLESGIHNISVCLCGNHTKNLDYWNNVDLPKGTAISMDPCMDDRLCVSGMSDRYHIAWGVSKERLRYGSREDVYRNALEIIAKYGKRVGGFTLMADCGLPFDSPEENVRAFIQAAEDFVLP